ncbi:Rib/alpha-like domain-containing protein, partial [Streptococcus danieliae]
KNTPVAKDQTVEPGSTPKAEDSIANLSELPAGTKVSFKYPVDTSTAGDKPTVVLVTYPDGSVEELAVLIKVSFSAKPTNENTGSTADSRGVVDSSNRANEERVTVLPNTGENSELSHAAMLLGAGMLTALSLVGRKKREDEE